MEQIIRRREVIGQYGDVLVGQHAVVISHAEVVDRIGEETLVERGGALNDLPDVQALFVFRGDYDHVLYGIHADVVWAARGKNVSLREDAALGFDKGPRNLPRRAGDGADEIGDDDAVGSKFFLCQLEKLTCGKVKRHSVRIVGVDQDNIVLIWSTG